MSEYNPRISEIYEIRNLMNAMEDGGSGFFRWDSSIAYLVGDDEGGLTEYAIVWNHNIDQYEVVVAVVKEGADA
jgi:hypothetical protein